MAVSTVHGRQLRDGTVHGDKLETGTVLLAKLAEAVIQADGGQAFTADQSMGGNQLTNVGDPIADQDAATRAWVLTQVAGITTSAVEARMATTANVTLSGTQTVDGVAGSANDVVFVRAQTAAADNGLYSMAAGAWTRIAAADTWDELVGLLVVVREGTTYADTLHLITADTGGTLGTTAVTSVQLPSPQDILGGAGIVRTGQTFDIVAGDDSITVNPDSVVVKRSGTGAIVLDATNGIAVAVDDSSIERSGNAIRVKALGITNAMLAGGISDDKLVEDYLIATKYIVRETPTGAVDGVNTTYTLANTPVAGKEMVFLNGVLQEPGVGNDYTISGATITYLSAPFTGDKVRVTYVSQ